MHSHLRLSSFQRCLLLKTLASNLHLHSHVSCHFMCLVSLVLGIRLNTLIFKSLTISTGQKMKFSIEHFFSKCYQIGRFLWIWSHLLKKSLMENLIFCAVIGNTHFCIWIIDVVTITTAFTCFDTKRIKYRLITININNLWFFLTFFIIH